MRFFPIFFYFSVNCFSIENQVLISVNHSSTAADLNVQYWSLKMGTLKNVDIRYMNVVSERKLSKLINRP